MNELEEIRDDPRLVVIHQHHIWAETTVEKPRGQDAARLNRAQRKLSVDDSAMPVRRVIPAPH